MLDQTYSGYFEGSHQRTTQMVTKQAPRPLSAQLSQRQHCKTPTRGHDSAHLCHDHSAGRLELFPGITLLPPFFFRFPSPALLMPDVVDLTTCCILSQIQVVSNLGHCCAAFVHLLENLQHRDPRLGIPADPIPVDMNNS